jgi:hypothetical protein
MFKKLKKSMQKMMSGVDVDAVHQMFDSMNRERSEHLAELERLRNEQVGAAEKLQVAQREIEEIREKERLLEEKRNGTEPWVEIKSAEYNEIHGFKIELDWNEAFIQYLKESGIKGRNEEEVVQKWLGFLYGDLIEKLERTAIDKADTKRTNDFL